MVLNKDKLDNDVLEVNEDFETINPTKKCKKIFYIKVILVPLTIFFMMLILFSLENIFKETDKIEIGIEITGEELNQITPYICRGSSSDENMPDSIDFLQLVRSYYYSKNDSNINSKRIVELKNVGYGEYICGYLSYETIEKIENEKSFTGEMNDKIYYNGIDDIYLKYQLLKEKQLQDTASSNVDEMILYRCDNNITYKTQHKRLVVVWREWILEYNDGSQIKVFCQVDGEVINDNYVVKKTIFKPYLMPQVDNPGDKFLIVESKHCIFAEFSNFYRFNIVEVTEYNGVQAIYYKHWISSDLEAPLSENERQFMEFFQRLLDEVTISRKLANSYSNGNEYWDYWLDYSKLKEILNIL